MRYSIRWAALLWAGLLASVLPAQTTQPAGPDTTRPTLRILVDSIHAHNYLSPESARAFEYHQAYGQRAFFNFLRKFAAVEEVTDGRLTPERLAGVSALYINLVSPDLPPFYVDEILAIRDFVQKGGGLFVFVEHSSCYFSAQKIGPVLDVFDIRNYNETACDDAPQRLGESPGWIAVDHFQPHPILRDVGWYAMQTGGTIDDRCAIATLSPKGWGDLWTMQPYGESSSSIGHFGNWTREPAERSGALGVCAAKEFGKGKVFVIADQNMVGDPFLHYAGNYRVAINAMGWLCNDLARINGQVYYDTMDRHILFFEPKGHFVFGDVGIHGLSNLFMAASRQFPAFAFDDLTGKYDMLVLADDRARLTDQQKQILLDRIKGGLIVLILQSTRTSDGAFLKELTLSLGECTEAVQPGYVSYRWEKVAGELRWLRNVPVDNNTISPPESAPTLEQRNTMQILENQFKSVLKR